MKIVSIALLLLFSFQINAQIPDSLGVDLPWPWQRIDECGKSMGEGPMTQNEKVFIQLESDIVEEGDFDNCIKRTRTWSIYDVLGGETYTYVQTGNPNFLVPFICQENLLITTDQLPLTLNVEDVVLNQIQDHEYSFSYNDINDVERVIEAGEEDNYEVFIYDHTHLKVCKVSVYLTTCEEEIILDIPATATVEFNKEPYLELTAEMLDVDIVYPCGSFETEVKVGYFGFDNLLKPIYIGYVIPVQVIVKFDDGNKYVSIIQVSVSGTKPDPIPMYIEEKSFVAGETIELDIWSEEILGLLAWQLQLQFVNVEVLDVVESDMFIDIPSNILDDGTTVRTLWFPGSTLPIDAEAGATWFTLTIRPDFDGSTLDIFQTIQDPWSLIAIDDVNYIYQYEAEFVFNIAPRDVLSIGDEITFTEIEVFPNPTFDKINIKGIPNSNSLTRVEIFNLEGKLMLEEDFTTRKSTYTLDISELPTGVFIIKTQTGNVLSSQKLSKF